ncbi:hypothetical protein KPL70_017227 [Citrus sinensis]|nr:hypothetical protein KPL70_017227 [Citrus sinensis]
MIQTSVQFAGMLNDDPNAHIVNFLEICDTFKQNGVSDNVIRLRLFPFSLTDKAKEWLNSLPAGTITTWDGLAHKFLAKYFPPARTAKLRNEITTFAQFEIKSLYEATMIDAAAGGTLMGKTPEVTYELLEEMAFNNYHWSSKRSMARKTLGAHNIDVVTALSAQMTTLSNKLEHLNVSAIHTQNNTQNVLAPPLGFQPQEKKSNLKGALTQLTTNMSQFMTKTETTFQNQSASIQNLEVQVGQIANLLSSRQYGSLPSNTETNSKEQVNVIILRSGKQLDELRKEAKKVDEEQVEDTTKVLKAASLEIPQPQPATPVKAYIPPIPFLQRLRKNTIDKQFLKFLDVFKKLHINIPFADALEQMPLYAKFMKEILSNKRKFEEHETVMLTEDCTAILQNKLPPRLKDPGKLILRVQNEQAIFNVYTHIKYPTELKDCFQEDTMDRKMAKSLKDKYLSDPPDIYTIHKQSINEDPFPYFRGKMPNCKNFVQGPSISSPCIHKPP